MQTPNQFEKLLAQGFEWIRTHREQFWAVTGGTLLAILLVGLVIHHRETEANEAWTQLGTIQGNLMQGKFEEARKAQETWSSRFQGTSARSYAAFMKADLLYRTSDYIQAAALYGELAQTGRPDLLKPLALSAQVSAEEMAGHVPQAQALAQSFLDKYPDHFLTAPMYLSQARLAEMGGNRAAADAIYQRFVVLYPQSPWAALAKAHTQNSSK